MQTLQSGPVEVNFRLNGFQILKVQVETLPCQQQTMWMSTGSRQQQQSDQPKTIKNHMIKDQLSYTMTWVLR